MKPWRAKAYKGGYSAEFLPEGASVWRILRKAGKVHVFPSRVAAKSAAEDAFLSWLRGGARFSLENVIAQQSEELAKKMATKLQAEAESWLKSSREDKKKATTLRRPGRRVVTVVRGRA